MFLFNLNLIFTGHFSIFSRIIALNPNPALLCTKRARMGALPEAKAEILWDCALEGIKRGYFKALSPH